ELFDWLTKYRKSTGCCAKAVGTKNEMANTATSAPTDLRLHFFLGLWANTCRFVSIARGAAATTVFCIFVLIINLLWSRFFLIDLFDQSFPAALKFAGMQTSQEFNSFISPSHFPGRT